MPQAVEKESMARRKESPGPPRISIRKGLNFPQQRSQQPLIRT